MCHGGAGVIAGSMRPVGWRLSRCHDMTCIVRDHAVDRSGSGRDQSGLRAIADSGQLLCLVEAAGYAYRVKCDDCESKRLVSFAGVSALGRCTPTPIGLCPVPLTSTSPVLG